MIAILRLDGGRDETGVVPFETGGAGGSSAGISGVLSGQTPWRILPLAVLFSGVLNHLHASLTLLQNKNKRPFLGPQKKFYVFKQTIRSIAT